MNKEAGEALYLLEDYSGAAEMFLEIKDFIRIIECLDYTE